MIIDTSVLSKRKQKALKNVLRAVAQARSISAGRRQLAEGLMLKNVLPSTVLKLSSAQFSRNCRELTDLNINPVTIPRDWKIEYLPSLCHLIDVWWCEAMHDEVARDQRIA